MLKKSEELLNAIQDIYSSNFVVVDTETTGLTEDDEIIEISIIDKNGECLLDTRVKPTKRIPASASDIHGIKNSDVASSPTWLDIYPKVREIIKDKTVLFYNQKFDNRMLRQTCKKYGVANPRKKSVCVMLLYCDFINESRWQKLIVATQQCELPVFDAHGARNDAFMTLNLFKYMCGQYQGERVQYDNIHLECNPTKRLKKTQSNNPGSLLVSIFYGIMVGIIKGLFKK